MTRKAQPTKASSEKLTPKRSVRPKRQSAPKPKVPKTQPAKPKAEQEASRETEHYGDWWQAPHEVIAMLAVVLARYDANEGRWSRRDVQEDLLKAYTALSTCLARGGLKVVRG